MAKTVRISLRVLDQTMAAEVPMPPASVRFDAVLPLLRQLNDRSPRAAVGDVGASRMTGLERVPGIS